jgi:3-hydroxyacyl-CoA dehydrogenase
MMADVESYERQGAVALIAIDTPPVNAASAPVRAGLVDALGRAAADGARAIGLYGAGRTFVAGADIREFGRPPADPWLPEVCLRIEDSPVPVACILHGTALGGGLEIALAASARLALPGTRLGLPEVNLGIIPGAGGTQRAPRLAGVAAALDLILSGKPIPAERARELGLIDRIVEGPPREAALAAARALAEGELIARRTGELTARPDPEAVARAEAALPAHLHAPRRAIEAVAASDLPLAEGLARERALFRRCLDHPQRAALVHAFFAERAAAKFPEAGAAARDVAALGVVGGGTMGTGIATAALLAGVPVTLVERDAGGAAAARGRIGANLDGALRRGKLTPETRAEAERALTLAHGVEALSRADLIVEAVFEDLDAKRAVFARLGALARPGAVLATNTSYLDVDAIAAASGRAGDVLGLHFFSPAHVMRLLEIVPGRQTEPGVVATALRLAKRLGKLPVRAGNVEGFIGNRLLLRQRGAAERLMLAGASPYAVDAALEAWGFALGPFATSDLAGLDIARAARDRRRAAMDAGARRAAAIPDRLCDAGRIGRKAGRGYYAYDDAGRREDPDVLALIAEERARAGIDPRDVPAEEIVDRVLGAIIAEGARLLADGTATRASDVDLVAVAGYGFPRFRGGPLFEGDRVGAPEVAARLTAWAEEDPFWAPPAPLARLARVGGTLADLARA